QVSKIDCALRVAVQYYLQDSDIKKLCESTIKKIRVYATEGYLEFEVKNERRELIKNTFLLYNSII
ncbi:MAG: hypothetical protein RIR01_1332, partial [Bacteroidota bacterium]